MALDDLLTRISVDSRVCFGKPCIRGHRIWVSLILDRLAGGASHQEILDDYPGLIEDDIRACIAYGSEMSRERYVDVPMVSEFVKLKLDENLPIAAGAPLTRDGHDVASVHSQNLEGSLDPDLIEVCRQEERCLVTLDIEFGNPLIYDSSRYAGIALIRIPGRIGRGTLLEAVNTLAQALRKKDIVGRLWIVQPGRIREYQRD